jgi:hypothetical protein
MAAVQRLYKIEFEHAGTVNGHPKFLGGYA